MSLEGLAIHARKKASGDGDDEDNKVKEGGKDVRRKLKSRMITTEDLGNSLISAIYNGMSLYMIKNVYDLPDYRKNSISIIF